MEQVGENLPLSYELISGFVRTINVIYAFPMYTVPYDLFRLFLSEIRQNNCIPPSVFSRSRGDGSSADQ